MARHGRRCASAEPRCAPPLALPSARSQLGEVPGEQARRVGVHGLGRERAPFGPRPPQVDGQAAADDGPQAAAVAEHADVGGGSPSTTRTSAAAPGSSVPTRPGIRRARAPLRVAQVIASSGREPEVAHEQLELAGVPVADGREREARSPSRRAWARRRRRPSRIIAAVASISSRNSVHAGRAGPDLGAVVGQVGEERERRADRRAVLDDERPTASSSRKLAWRIEVDTRPRAASRVDAALRQWATTGVSSSWAVSHTTFISSSGPDLQLAGSAGDAAGGVDLDPVGAVLDLLPGDLDHLVAVAHHLGVAARCPRRG